MSSLQPHGLYSPWNSPGQNTRVGSLSLLQGISQPRDQTRSPTLQADSLPAEPPGKPKNTGVGGLSLLQQIFPTQGLKRGLLHHRRILYQLGYQASPLLHSCFKVCSSSISGLHIDSVKVWGAVVHKSPVEMGVQSLERASRVTQWESPPSWARKIPHLSC